MACSERRGLLENWVMAHDRLCRTLDECERRLATERVGELEVQEPPILARLACERAMEMLEEHEEDHGCSPRDLV